MNKKKMIKILAFTSIFVLILIQNAFAGEWRSNHIGWWYRYDNGTYPINQWEWIDGNKDGISECYYFNENGYLLVNTTTSDNYQVNQDGAWVVAGVVQTQGAKVYTGSVTARNSNNSSSGSGGEVYL